MSKEFRQILFVSIVISIILSVLFGSLAGLSVGSYVAGQFKPTSSTSSQVNLIDAQNAVIAAVEKASPGVVSIVITKNLPQIDRNNPLLNDPLFRQLFGDQFDQYFGQNDNTQNGQQNQEVGGGTGFIVSPDGYIVTNKHVVADTGADYTVLMGADKRYSAKVLARDSANDLAILKIEAVNLPTLQMGDSSNLKVGQTAIAIGNALAEFRNTVSVGVISGLARSIVASMSVGSESLVGVIQTDASINLGNSGGPLLDINGQVIGVNTALVYGAQGIGFAIPINELKSAIESVKKTGRIVRPWLGVRVLPITKEIQASSKLPVDYGALITRGEQAGDLAIIPGSPADKAGLMENDIILEVNGEKISGDALLSQVIAKYQVGQVVSLKILHRGSEKIVMVKLEEAK